MKLVQRMTLLGCLLFQITLISFALQADEPTWSAGFSKADITPTESIWLSGYGSRNRNSEGTRLPLNVKACALDSGKKEVGMVLTFDLVGLDRETATKIRSNIMVRTGIPEARISLCSSHTHTGPVVGHNLEAMYDFNPSDRTKLDHYTETLIASAIQAGSEAWERRKPVRLSWSTGQATFGVNRRNNPEGLVTAYRSAGKLKGPVDYDVPVLRIADKDGHLVGLIFGYACHATVLDDYQWSGDSPGFAQRELETRFPECTALFVAGCGADVNPLPRRTAELAQRYGTQLADAVTRALDGVQLELPPALEIRGVEVELGFDAMPAREDLEKRKEASDVYSARSAKYLLRQWDEKGSLAATYPYPISVWRLGSELTWIFLGGEAVVDYSLTLKKIHGPNTWVTAYSHDVMAYIPSRRVWEEGGYEGGTSMIYYGLPSRWASDVEDRILGAVKAVSGTSKR